MAEPRLILLDEPVAGVNPRLIEDIVAVIKRLREQGQNFLLIEHNMNVVRQLCDVICVLDMGRTLAQGPPQELLAREDVLQAYIAAGGVTEKTEAPALRKKEWAAKWTYLKYRVSRTVMVQLTTCTNYDLKYH